MNNNMTAAPYSQCDAKGRCIRHPAIQMSRKKKLGGWKTLLSLCPMCAMELMANDNNNDQQQQQVGGRVYCGDVAAPSSAMRDMHAMDEQPPSSSRHSSSSRHGSRRSSRYPHHGHGDDRSIGQQSVRSAPSTYNRRDSQDSSGNYSSTSSSSGGPPSVTKRQDGSDSSCDSTVDMSYSSHSSAGYASPRGSSLRRSNSGGDGSHRSAHSSGSRASHHSARSSGSSQRRRHRQAPRIGHHDAPPPSHNANEVNTLPRNQEQFVCGMEYGSEPGMYYTGQIDVQTRLPHGLGTLRSDNDKTMFEGQWHFGRLVQESGAAASSQAVVAGQEYQEDEEYECKNYDDYCLPCTDNNGPSQQHAHYDDSLSNNFQRQCHVTNLEDCVEEEEDESSSFSNNSIAETIHDEDSESQSSWSRSASSSYSSQNSSYSARESKNVCLPPPRTSNSQGTSRATYNKLQEYERYVEQCDTDEDCWYSHDDGSRSRASSSRGDYDRPKKVRFREDP